MDDVLVDATHADHDKSDPLEERHPGDKLAILCATRPGHYVVIRVLAPTLPHDLPVGGV